MRRNFAGLLGPKIVAAAPADPKHAKPGGNPSDTRSPFERAASYLGIHLLRLDHGRPATHEGWESERSRLTRMGGRRSFPWFAGYDHADKDAAGVTRGPLVVNHWDDEGSRAAAERWVEMMDGKWCGVEVVVGQGVSREWKGLGLVDKE